MNFEVQVAEVEFLRGLTARAPAVRATSWLSGSRPMKARKSAQNQRRVLL